MHRLDMQHAVVEIGSGDLHVIGEAEAPLERAPRDAAVQVTATVLSLLFLLRLARHQERVLPNGDIEFGRDEPGHGHGQPIGMFTGRPATSARRWSSRELAALRNSVLYNLHL